MFGKVVVVVCFTGGYLWGYLYLFQAWTQRSPSSTFLMLARFLVMLAVAWFYRIHREMKSKTYNRVSRGFMFHATPVRDGRQIEMSSYITDQSYFATRDAAYLRDGTSEMENIP